MGVYLGAGKTVYDYSAMQGPCESGFHIPTKDEWDTIKSIGVSLGAWTSSGGGNFSSYLKIPLCGFRSYDSNVYNANTDGYYWSSINASSSDAYRLFLNSGYLSAGQTSKICGHCIRPFKDEPVVPDSSWTRTYTGTGDAGIYRNSSLGLISISSDGTTWKTIADKNLGATSVWSSGNPTSANGGLFYQRGNNYGFAISGGISTTTSKANTTGYGPGNYYSRNTFYKSSYYEDWANSTNNNLRGGETGVQPKIVYPELKNAYIGEYVPNFATQGPAPDGFHVPLSSEWTTIDGILRYTFGLGLDRDYTTECLKMPYAGQRQNETSNTEFQGSLGYYRCADGANAYETDEDARPTVYTNAAARGLSIRPFKNAPVTPDSSRTVLYQGIGSAGVYHNSTLGLISISGDGTTRYTIADKNLGATQVWNSGDTLSEANCGGYYQCGNNYMFPFTGSVTTSSTQVDASSYGPGNYYSSSTFIIGSLRDSSGNGNLRGGVDGNVPVD